MSEGALVVDVKEDTDTKEIPPCIILKSDGASLYSTTDLATLVMRMKENNPDPCDLSGRRTSVNALYPGVPLCKKDRHST